MYVSPTGYNDPDNKWADETLTYDENTGTFAYTYDNFYVIELLHAALYCSQIRVWAALVLTTPPFTFFSPDVHIGIYYDSAWHGIWDGLINYNAWVELATPEFVLISKMRMAFLNIGAQQRALLFEMDFYEFTPLILRDPRFKISKGKR